MRSLSGKLVLLAVTSTGITAGALSAVQLRQTSDRETEIAFIRLEDLAKRNARTIGLQLERVQQEARFISGFPPIAGIQRARMNGDAYDLHGFSTEAELRERLSGIFKSVIRERPSYAQIRLIGKDGNWREIVRVDRRGDDIFTVPEDQLQSKAGETYLEGIEGMKPGDDYFADITLNRENRLDVGPAMLRMVRPVFGPQGDLFGAVVINVDAERLMRDAVSDISSQVTIVTSEGHYMRFGPGYPEPDLELSGAWDWVTPPNWDFRNDHGRHIRDGTAYFVAGLHLGGLSRALVWHVITERPISALLGKSREHVRSGIAVSGLIMALAMLASWAWGRRITGPLRKLHATIIAYDGESNLADRPKFGRDEIGALAEAFWRLSDDLMGETRRTESLFRVAASGIIVINRNGRIEKINAAAEALFGYGPEELFGQNLSCLMDRDTAAQHPGFIKGFHHGTKPMSRAREIFGVRKDGSRVPLDIPIRLSYEVDGHEIMASTSPATNRSNTSS